MILLNEFRKDGWQKRIYANEELDKLREQRLNEQIDKASAICQLINSHRMECPWIS